MLDPGMVAYAGMVCWVSRRDLPVVQLKHGRCTVSQTMADGSKRLSLFLGILSFLVA